MISHHPVVGTKLVTLWTRDDTDEPVFVSRLNYEHPELGFKVGCAIDWHPYMTEMHGVQGLVLFGEATGPLSYVGDLEEVYRAVMRGYQW